MNSAYKTFADMGRAIARMTPYRWTRANTWTNEQAEDALATINRLIAEAQTLARQPEANKARAVEFWRALALESLQAWEGEKESVQEEHFQLIEKLRAASKGLPPPQFPCDECVGDGNIMQEGDRYRCLTCLARWSVSAGAKRPNNYDQ